MENSSKLSIPDFYNGKSVLLTGGFGFLGKVIIEKLLRSCPEIENIFLLARSKKGKNVQERLDEIINTPPFANLKEKSPEVFKKIVLIEGDVAEENLGISETDQKLICDKVSIFIHNAATINFNEPLKTAVDTNLRSVREMINLAKKAKNLDALVHVSSAFTNWFESDNDKILVEEKIYPNPYNPDDIIKITQLMPDDVLNKITPSLLGKHTNTYTFTKNLAEHLIVNEGKDMPIAIIRPSMVLGSSKEPMPGWLDSWVGPTTYAYLIARGLLRSWHVHKNNVGEVIPVDMTVNLIIASAWKVGIEKNLKEPQIYHSVTGANPITWEKMFKQYLANAKKYPLDDVFWYPNYRMRETKFCTKLDAFFTQRIPAYLIDFASVIMGKKPKMICMQDKIEYGYSFTRFSATNPIRFECKNYEKIINKMNSNDVKEFDFDVRKINWNKFIEDQFLGARKYLYGSKSTDFVTGRRKIAKLRIANYVLVGSILTSSLYLLNRGVKFIWKNDNSKKVVNSNETIKNESLL